MSSAPSGSGAIVELPPIFVEAEHGSGPDWRHGQIPGFEVLSCCDDSTTERFILRIAQQKQALKRIVPERFLLESDVPSTVILFRKSLENSMASEMADMMEKVGQQTAGSRLRPLPHLRLDESDSTAIYAILDDDRAVPFRAGQLPLPTGDTNLVLSPTYLEYLIEARGPATPAWLSVGISRFYGTDRFRESETDFGPDEWLSPESARRLTEDPGSPRPFLPMGEVFIPGLPTSANAEYRQTWAAESELFVRWAMSRAPTRDALWRFVDRLQREPPTDDLFAEYFGHPYADIRDELSDTLPSALTHRVTWDSAAAGRGSPGPDPDLGLREATPAEIRRIRGDWSRRSLRMVGSDHPALVAAYAGQARNSLQRSYDVGDRDPRLLSSLALLHIQTGDDRGATPLLEAAFASGGATPLALTELARIRFTNAIGSDSDSTSSLDEAQARRILEPIEAARRRKPALRATYALAAQVRFRRLTPPDAHELEVLNEGAWLFARDTKVLIAAAYWDLQTGDRDQARKLANLGLWLATDPALRAKLETLQKAIGPPPPGKPAPARGSR